MAKRKPKSADNMKAIAAMLVCPHQWGAAKKVRVMDGGKARDGNMETCGACGTRRIKWPDGTGTMFSPEALSNSPST